MPERRQTDRDDPRAAGTSAQLVRHAELQQALGEEIRQRARRVHQRQHDQHAGEAHHVRRGAERDQAHAERHQDREKARAAGRRAADRYRREAEDPADGARRAERAESFRPGVKDVAGQAREQRLVGKPEDFGAGRQHHQHEKRPVSSQRAEKIQRALPQRGRHGQAASAWRGRRQQ